MTMEDKWIVMITNNGTKKSKVTEPKIYPIALAKYTKSLLQAPQGSTVRFMKIVASEVIFAPVE